jgi:hypothetical protein
MNEEKSWDYYWSCLFCAYREIPLEYEETFGMCGDIEPYYGCSHPEANDRGECALIYNTVDECVHYRSRKNV